MSKVVSRKKRKKSSPYIWIKPEDGLYTSIMTEPETTAQTTLLGIKLQIKNKRGRLVDYVIPHDGRIYQAVKIVRSQ